MACGRIEHHDEAQNDKTNPASTIPLHHFTLLYYDGAAGRAGVCQDMA
jgi:hypothetical protein